MHIQLKFEIKETPTNNLSEPDIPNESRRLFIAITTKLDISFCHTLHLNVFYITDSLFVKEQKTFEEVRSDKNNVKRWPGKVENWVKIFTYCGYSPCLIFKSCVSRGFYPRLKLVCFDVLILSLISHMRPRSTETMVVERKSAS